ncbi:MAG TPA: cyclopropane-fatty-acyl-phospholipid synthase family protein [Acidobacteriaceae bacterium]
MHSSPVRFATNGVAKQIATALFKRLAAICEPIKFSVKFWDETILALSPNPRFTIAIRDPHALSTLFVSPDELTLGESFIHGSLEIEGDWEEAFRLGEILISFKADNAMYSSLRKLIAMFPRVKPRANRFVDDGNGEIHSRERDRAAIGHHYDVSNDFYRLWLDERLLYTAAYFESAEEDLETAQIRKLDYICRKLDLHPGERLLDIGCGWGGLLIHAASHYGVEARGITLSMRQAELARERIGSAGLQNRCAVQICDYRDVEGDGTYDKIASIGMIEHVGRSNLELYFNDVWRLLRDGGLFLNSGITASATWRRRGDSFIDNYVFPDGDLVPLHETLREAEMGGFEVRDVDCLREHYAFTLDRWIQRLDERAAEARLTTDDLTYRTWKLYMAGSAHAFRTNRINLYQLLLSKPDGGRCALPLTRHGWYEEAIAGGGNIRAIGQGVNPAMEN